MFHFLLYNAIMIRVMCRTDESLTLGELMPFQGDLKKRTKRDISSMAKSIAEEGLLMPFAIWRHDDVNYLLDGHCRFLAVTDIALTDNEVASQQLPVIYIDAETVDDARKALLQITSSYGKITKEGAVNFCKTIPTYKAPSINKFIHRKPRERKLNVHEHEQVIRIAVPSDKAQAVLDLFKSVDYIRVL